MSSSISPATKNDVEAATVYFLHTGGRGVLVPGGLIITAAHVIKWTHDGSMILDPDEKFVQHIVAGSRRLLAYPLAVEPVADLAILGALDDQWAPQAAVAFEQFRLATPPVLLAAAKFPFGLSIPAHVFTHTGDWIAGHVTQYGEMGTMFLETEKGIRGGTSGSAVVTDDGLLLGIVSNIGGPSGAPKTCGTIPRPHLAAPVWLAKRMLTANRECTVDGSSNEEREKS